MLLSDWLLFFDKNIIALSGGHFEYFLTFSKNNYTCLGSRNMTVRLFKGLLNLILKSPLFPLFQRGIIMSSPLWQRGVRGDFVKIFDSIGVK